MKIGIPQGLLYSKYHVFAKTFLEELGAEVIISPNTNKSILNQGVSCCVDEACLPIKVFHGHVASLKNKCDTILIPRFMGLAEKESICPMFCGLIEMVSNNIPELPDLIDTPIYSVENKKLCEWAKKVGSNITKDQTKISCALNKAMIMQEKSKNGFDDEEFPLKIGLIGHVNNIFDNFINMNLKKKLNGMDVGVITSEYIDKEFIDEEVKTLFKKPFWTFAREYFGSAVYMYKTHKVDGIIYLSSFSCGIDSIVTELIKTEIEDFPFMILKLDEHTGEAGFDTRIEAFTDMLKRRCTNGINFS